MLDIPPAPAPDVSRKPMTYKTVTRYDLETGRLLGNCRVDEECEPQPGEGHLPGMIDIAKYYYSGDGEIMERQPLGATLSADVVTLGESVTIAPLPVPCDAMVTAMEPLVIGDGVLEITPQSVGVNYRVVIDAVGHLRESFYFDVVEP